jgi:hypothetical protein
MDSIDVTLCKGEIMTLLMETNSFFKNLPRKERHLLLKRHDAEILWKWYKDHQKYNKKYEL